MGGNKKLLACPDDALDDGDLVQAKAAILESVIEAFQVDSLGGDACEALGPYVPGAGLGHHPVAAPHIGRG